MLEIISNKLMLNKLLRIAKMLLYYNKKQLRDNYCNWKKIARYINLYSINILIARSLC